MASPTGICGPYFTAGAVAASSEVRGSRMAFAKKKSASIHTAAAGLKEEAEASPRESTRRRWQPSGETSDRVWQHGGSGGASVVRDSCR